MGFGYVYRNLYDLWYRPIKSPVVVRTLESITSEQKKEFENNLCRLVDIFGNELWVLGGGAAAQLTTGGLSIKPGNFNLSLPVENLKSLSELASKQGYALLSRGWQIRCKERIKLKDKLTHLVWEEEVEVRRETYEEIEWKGSELKKPYSNIRLVKLRDEEDYFKNPDFLDFIDVHPFKMESYKPEGLPQFHCDYLVSFDKDEGDLIIPRRFADDNLSYSTQNGIKIRVRSHKYMENVLRWFVMRKDKSQRRKPQSWHLLGKIYGFLNYGFDKFCENYINSKTIDLRRIPTISGVSLKEMARLWGKDERQFRLILKEYIEKQKAYRTQKTKELK